MVHVEFGDAKIDHQSWVCPACYSFCLCLFGMRGVERQLELPPRQLDLPDCG